MRRGASTLATILATVSVTLLVLVGGGVLFALSGAYDVSARTREAAPVHWLLETTMERSVARRTDDVPPLAPADSTVVAHGLREYQEMCVTCHAGPGIERSAIGAGLNPRPPLLARSARDMDDREVYWLIANGVKMSGMPAFGETHDNETIRALTAFVRRLTQLSPEEYRGMVTAAGLEMPEHEGGEGH